MGRLALVAPDADHLTVGVEHDGADGHLASLEREAGLVQGTAYGVDVLRSLLHPPIIA